MNPDVHRPHHHELVVVRPAFGRHPFGADLDYAELRDAAHELPCGHLPLERCDCGLRS